MIKHNSMLPAKAIGRELVEESVKSTSAFIHVNLLKQLVIDLVMMGNKIDTYVPCDCG